MNKIEAIYCLVERLNEIELKTRLKRDELIFQFALTFWNFARYDMRIDDLKTRNMIFVKSLLTIIKKIKWFSRKKMIFSIHVVLKKRRLATTIEFEIENNVDVSSTFIVNDDNEFSRNLILIKQRIDNCIIQKIDMKDEMNLYKNKKLELDN